MRLGKKGRNLEERKGGREKNSKERLRGRKPKKVKGREDHLSWHL